MKRLRADEILIYVRDLLRDDQRIIDWCTETYGKRHIVYCGVNNEDPPEENKYPLIALFYCGRRKSSNTSVVGYGIELATAVFDNDIEVTTVTIPDPPGGTMTTGITYHGLLRVAEFRELVELVIETSHLGRIDFNSDTWDENLYPYFTSNSIFEFERPKNYSGPTR